MPHKPLCIIPARGGSKRIPRKNIALVAGRPLISYTIEAALRSDVFDLVCVSSDDDEILDVARACGAGLALKRPLELSTEKAQVKDVCLYLLEYFAGQGQAYGEFGVLLPSNPLRTSGDIQAAYEIFKAKDANYVMSLVPYSHPPQRAVWAPQGYVQPYFGLRYMKQAELLDTLYRHDGAIIFGKSEVFLKEKEFYGTGVVPYFIPAERSIDIDNPLDLEWAEFVFSSLDRERGKKVESRYPG